MSTAYRAPFRTPLRLWLSTDLRLRVTWCAETGRRKRRPYTSVPRRLRVTWCAETNRPLRNRLPHDDLKLTQHG